MSIDMYMAAAISGQLLTHVHMHMAAASQG